MDNFVTISSAATILGVSKMTLRNWDHNGKLRAHRHPFNNYRVYKMTDLDKVIEAIENNLFTGSKGKNTSRKLLIKHLDN